MEKLAIRLKELREERGLSQMAAGTALGVSRSTIAGYETKGREPDVLRHRRAAADLDRRERHGRAQRMEGRQRRQH